MRGEESGRVFFCGKHTGDVRKETHVVSVMNWPPETVEVRDEMYDRLLPHQVRRPRLTIEGVYTIGLFSRILSEKNVFYVNTENLDQNTPSNSPRAPDTKSKFGKERVHREELSKSVNLMSVVLARQN